MKLHGPATISMRKKVAPLATQNHDNGQSANSAKTNAEPTGDDEHQPSTPRPRPKKKVVPIRRMPSHLSLMLAATTAASVVQPSTGIVSISDDFDALLRHTPACSAEDVNERSAAEPLPAFQLASSNLAAS